MTLPAPLAEIVDDFAALDDKDKVTLLLEFAAELPPLPEQLQEASMEPVPECQSPIFLSVDAADANAVKLYFSAPAEAPTTRGFAAILHEGLSGQSASAIAAVPADFVYELSLGSVISPLRLRGMSGMLARIKRQVIEQTGSDGKAS